MIVSWNWLSDYLRLDMPAEVLADRLALAGLNLESISDVEGDIAIDLEVTSNRPDCLGHLGVAREIAVLFGKSLCVPRSTPGDGGTGRRDPHRRLGRGSDALSAVYRTGGFGSHRAREPMVAA